MRIKQLLHPEVILDRRGGEWQRKIYRELLKSLVLDAQSKRIFFKSTNAGQIELMQDVNFKAHMTLCKAWLRDNGGTYYVPAEFLQALSKLDRKLPVEYFPDRFVGYFHFADGALSDDEGIVEGGYVFVGPANEIGVDFDAVADQNVKAVMLCYLNPHTTKDGVWWSVTRFTFPLVGETMSDLVQQSDNSDRLVRFPADPGAREKVYRAMVNAVLYVNSADPEVLKLRPIAELSHSKRAAYKEACGGNANECTVAVTLLNWGYGQERQYSVDSTVVQTHLRWQPCGPNRSKVKLIWVTEHERHYNREFAAGDVGHATTP